MSNSKFKSQNSATSKPHAEYVLSIILAKAEHHINDYVDGDLLDAIRYHSLASRTKEMSILCSLLGVIAAISAEKCTVSLGCGHKVHSSAINLLIVAKPGSGKSSAIDDFCINQMDKLSSVLKNLQYTNPGSFAGELNFSLILQ